MPMGQMPQPHAGPTRVLDYTPVTVEGYLNGTIAAVEVVLGSTAVVRGEVVAEKIRIDFGANVEGRLLATDKPETDTILTQDKASDAATKINDSSSSTPRLL